MVDLALDVSNVDPISLELAQQAKLQGVVALIAKGTEGVSYKDPTLSKHRQIADKLGLRFGSYLFLHAHSPGKEAAEYLRYAKPRPNDMVILDVEGGGLDEDGVAAIARRAQACATVLELKGFRPIVYCSSSWWPQLVAAAPGLKHLRVWEAQYPSPAQRWLPRFSTLRVRLGSGASVVMWQWTDRYAVGVHHYDCSRVFVPANKL